MTSSDCLFCKMNSGEISVEKVFEDEDFFCIRDIQPQAKTHLLLIPKVHVESLAKALESSSVAPFEKILKTAAKIAKKEGLLPDGFRSVINTNQFGGQSVFHLHLHILGGQQLSPKFS